MRLGQTVPGLPGQPALAVQLPVLDGGLGDVVFLGQFMRLQFKRVGRAIRGQLVGYFAGQLELPPH